MKKYYASVVTLAAALSLSAQQLPNFGFEGEWVDSKPWNSVYADLTMSDALAAMGDTLEVTQPSGWIISNVLGVVSERDADFGGGYGAVGSTIVGTKAEGFNSATAVKLTNNPNPFMATQIVPAYISFGTSWATNTLDWTTFSPANKDGGVFGGLEFTMRPDAVAFDYKLEAPEGGEGQQATALFYAWKGSWSQDGVPGNNTMMDDQIVKKTMVDRDRNILGIATSQGGAITPSEDAELIAKGQQYITEFTSDWKHYELPIEYLTASAPAKINVVLSANDYFDSENIVSGNSLTVDNVNLVYYSRLKSLSVAGTPVAGFSSDVYTYELEGETPTEAEIAFEPMANAYSAKAEVAVDSENATVTVKVSNLNEGGLDIDGNATHEYVLKFKNAAEANEGDVYEGTVTIDMGSPVEIPGKVHIIPSDALVYPGKCTFMLPNFSLGEGAELGDIVVPDVTMTPTADGYSYEGAVKGLKLNMGGTDIVANVSLTGTTNNNTGEAQMNIPVIWILDPVNDPDGLAGLPIDVKFNGKKVTSAIDSVEAAPSAEAEYFNLNGVRVSADTLTPGIYVKRQGAKTSKVYVK